jgi:hypothetical protein
MFPLGSVLVPSMVLPLHVFEERYRTLTRDCLASEVPEFGVTLIERGSEVGGGDLRFWVGTVARILEAVELDDGRFALGTVGMRRIRVVRWLPDDPYPLAEVEDWEDPPPPAELTGQVEAATAVLRRVLALATELGRPAAPATIPLREEPVLASYQLVALSPLGPADQQDLLEEPDAVGRVERVADLLAEHESLLLRELELDGGSA